MPVVSSVSLPFSLFVRLLNVPLYTPSALHFSHQVCRLVSRNCTRHLWGSHGTTTQAVCHLDPKPYFLGPSAMYGLIDELILGRITSTVTCWSLTFVDKAPNLVDISLHARGSTIER